MKKYVIYLAMLASVSIAKVFSMNWILGSTGACFSGTTVIAPVLAAHAGLWSTALLLILAPLKSLTLQALLWSLLHRIPIIFAAWSYASRSILSWVILPIICMITFVVHDVGVAAWLYAMYWWIPVICFFMPDMVLTRALSSVFIAHAIGSVCFLYTHDFTYTFWLGLIPIVARERLGMVVGIVVLELVIAQVMASVYRFKKTFVQVERI